MLNATPQVGSTLNSGHDLFLFSSMDVKLLTVAFSSEDFDLKIKCAILFNQVNMIDVVYTPNKYNIFSSQCFLLPESHSNCDIWISIYSNVLFSVYELVVYTCLHDS